MATTLNILNTLTKTSTRNTMKAQKEVGDSPDETDLLEHLLRLNQRITKKMPKSSSPVRLIHLHLRRHQLLRLRGLLVRLQLHLRQRPGQLLRHH